MRCPGNGVILLYEEIMKRNFIFVASYCCLCVWTILIYMHGYSTKQLHMLEKKKLKKCKFWNNATILLSWISDSHLTRWLPMILIVAPFSWPTSSCNLRANYCETFYNDSTVGCSLVISIWHWGSDSSRREAKSVIRERMKLEGIIFLSCRMGLEKLISL